MGSNFATIAAIAAAHVSRVKMAALSSRRSPQDGVPSRLAGELRDACDGLRQSPPGLLSSRCTAR